MLESVGSGFVDSIDWRGRIAHAVYDAPYKPPKGSGSRPARSRVVEDPDDLGPSTPPPTKSQFDAMTEILFRDVPDVSPDDK